MEDQKPEDFKRATENPCRLNFSAIKVQGMDYTNLSSMGL